MYSVDNWASSVIRKLAGNENSLTFFHIKQNSITDKSVVILTTDLQPEALKLDVPQKEKYHRMEKAAASWRHINEFSGNTCSLFTIYMTLVMLE